MNSPQRITQCREYIETNCVNLFFSLFFFFCASVCHSFFLKFIHLALGLLRECDKGLEKCWNTAEIEVKRDERDAL